MARIDLVDVTKRFGSVEAARGVTLAIADGEFVTLLGPSGCGKTTTLNLVAGLEEVTSGEIRMDDRVVNDLSPSERDIAMVFQNYALYPHMTVRENIGFALRLAKRPAAEIAARVGKVAELLELGHVLDRLPRALSGGQQQRVALGRAIVREPKAFLFDEPFSNLDAGLRVRMRREIRELHLRLGITSLFVTHDQEEAMSISDRIAVMRDGRVEQFGTPDEIYARPASTYVARFVGNPQMDILEGAVATEGGAAVYRVGAAAFPIPRALPGEVDLGVRPEHVLLGGPGEAGVAARVVVAQPLGPVSFVTVAWDGGTLTSRVSGISRATPGDAVSVRFQTDGLLFFERSTGTLIGGE
ncbi:MAG: ABC transporter ATP-binding protein [Actinomycetota bacterium]